MIRIWMTLMMVFFITACGRTNVVEDQEVTVVTATEHFHPFKKEPVDVTTTCIQCY
ncbi:hypothetical protein [Legionella israelensis]|uniref:Uncharacterized protein n=1 Tax=Legionella israelensis TaxID=454 RepID=A0A0W0W1C8_9GAMM|nr:hypothetical protein [Legionella israelensis]KTD26057.1 hypothetical protein Lisr_1198 [Legionella israelensis]SCY26527.1 hypothetical protein SAMN02746069_01830 [Legionella israelensis DSM 19235]STX59743.1 Uncharacterised protein [Legionella israelensis]